ncbi:hypothetical protein CPG38_06895 [Malaciobacter marinus]|uniref:hypothetical protein n=1 Tax=Malaciobacter marinus TaxID=505249 RepID=UPI000C0689F1|nr:hypothetical protein [Malaciobacter marinus]PHO12569.1 hypothetical protein CPG38_06895 [Malaciobacter marinus]
MRPEYLGNDEYKFYMDNREITLNIQEMELISNEFKKIIHEQNSTTIFNFKREYNKNKKIKMLFNSYYDETRTKKEVLEKISKELNLSYKAVEKAYYKK